MTALEEFLVHQPAPSPAPSLGIGILGAGAIVNAGHLLAYQEARYNVVAIADVNLAAAQQTAARFAIPHAYDSLDALLADPAVQVVDFAVPPWVQVEGAPRAAASGRHVLCQKPLALTYDNARRIVEAAEAAGVKLAVNQQMRWEPLVAAAKRLLDAGWIGTATGARIDVNINTDWRAWPWMLDMPRMEIFVHSIHYLDTMRYLFGEPALVFSRGAWYPGQPGKGETRTLTVLDYGPEKQVFVSAEHNNQAGDTYAILRIDGTEGALGGRFGVFDNYPHGAPDDLWVISKRHTNGERQSMQLPGTWIPGAFVGPMGDLLRAAAGGPEPLTSGLDNLKTLQVALAAYRSMDEHRAVAPEEIG